MYCHVDLREQPKREATLSDGNMSEVSLVLKGARPKATIKERHHNSLMVKVTPRSSNGEGDVSHEDFRLRESDSDESLMRSFHFTSWKVINYLIAAAIDEV